MDKDLSLDGRQFQAVSDTIGGEVGTETIFEFSQEANLIWARYTGGQVRLGFLVGTSTGAELTFRYTQINLAGETSTGHSRDSMEVLSDGRVRLHETWAWDSHDGSGTSILEEMKESRTA